MKRIFFSAGEPSGDLHAAELITALQKRFGSDLECVGLGGPEMAKAGCNLHYDLTELAIMWFGRAILNLHKFYKLAKDAERFFASKKVDAVVLVDYPGFNWHIAKRAKKHGIPVFYFMPPQIWSWHQSRAKKMRRLIDHVLCSLPFEERWFRSKGCNVHWIGHPFFEEVKNRKLDDAFLDELKRESEGRPILTLLPGSRNQEVHVNFIDFLETVKKIRAEVPGVRPVVAAFKESQAEWIRNLLKEKDETDIGVHVKRTPELIHVAKCCLAVSGSVSLELLANKKPSVIYYRIGYIPYYVQRLARRTRYITLVNILAADARATAENVDPLTKIFYPDDMKIIPVEMPAEDREQALFPEFLTWRDISEEGARPLIEWLREPAKLAEREAELAALLEIEYQGGSPITNAVDVIERELVVSG